MGLFKKKKKVVEEDYSIFEPTRFRIPQMDYGTEGFQKGKTGFQKSKAASPYHGSNVPDKNSFQDNTNTVNVDQHFDFVRDEDKKHISEEELIAKYGTKYYEFQFIDDDKKNLAGSDYSKTKQEKAKEEFAFSFFNTPEDIVSDESLTNPVVEDEVEVDAYSEDAEFKLDVEMGANEPVVNYNSYNDNMSKPSQANIPSFLSNKKEEAKTLPEFESDELEFGDVASFEAPEIKFTENPAVDRNISISEAIKRGNELNKDYNPSNAGVPHVEAPYYEPEREEDVNVNYTDEHKYDDYEIPYKEIFKLSGEKDQTVPEWLVQKKEIINQALQSFGIDGEVICYVKGPAFTRYEILLQPGVNVKKINQIEDNLQKDLAAKSLRIQAPIPGKSTIGIEVPNDVSEMVTFGDTLEDDYMADKSKPLKVAMGKDIDGNVVYQNIPDMPHALIAGATQSGKSVSINTMLISLILKNSPATLKLILVDPKMVEFNFYEGLPHLATPIINDPIMATEALKWCCVEMDKRYDMLKRARVRNVGDYNKKREEDPNLEAMPFIVVVIDEFNDLVMQCGNEINDCIVRLAQKARAAGIHIILATQRPTADVVNGTIKGNIPTRIAFRVAARIDSMVILDEPGAESLLGRGDMIIKGNFAPVRAQGSYVTDAEIDKVCGYIIDRYEPDYLFTHEDLKKQMQKAGSGAVNGTKEAPGEDEAFLYQVALACLTGGSCSINSIQGAFGVGFNRAQRIVNILEEREIVSPKNGTKPREFLVDEYQLKQIFGVED